MIFALFLTLVSIKAAHIRRGEEPVDDRSHRKPLLAAAKERQGIRIYQNVGSDVEVGVAHTNDMDMLAGLAEHVGRAARAHINSISDNAMTGAHSPAATGPVDTFDYQGFSDQVDGAAESALNSVKDATDQAVNQARKAVLAKHGLATGSTGGETGSATSSETGSATGSATGSNEEPTGPADESISAPAPVKEAETGGADETGSATGGNLSPEELVHKLRKEAGATGEEESATGDEGATGETGATGDEKGSETGETASSGTTGSTGAATGGDGHWKWIKKSHGGSTTKRHADMVQ